MANQLLGIHFDDGLQMPHFLNGRLLTADDLDSEQEAMLTRLRYLGQAAGFGVVAGLEVSPAAGANNLQISGGLGVNRAGDLIRLSEKGAQISLVIAPNSKELGEDSGRFHDCGMAPSGTTISKGAYLLTVRPISRLEGSAPVQALRGNRATCASKWEVDGVEFVAIPLAGFSGNGQATDRNLLAHWCFGSEGLKQLANDPFHFSLREYLNILPANLAGLQDCDLPLAVFTWTAQGLGFLDNWAARRRIVLPYPGAAWDAFLSDMRLAEAQARFIQFQEQLEVVRSIENPLHVVATKYFRYLPPVGFLPIITPPQIVRRTAQEVLTEFVAMAKASDFLQRRIKGDKELSALLEYLFADFADQNTETLSEHTLPYLLQANNFDLDTFFGDKLPNRYALAPRETVDFTLSQSWHDEVIDLQAATPFDIFLVAESLIFLKSKVRYVLAQLLDNQKIEADPKKSLEFVKRFDLPTEQPIWYLWQKADLRQEFSKTITQEGKEFPLYAIFVKRAGPFKWVYLEKGDRDDKPKPDTATFNLEQMSTLIIGLAQKLKISVPDLPEINAPPSTKPVTGQPVLVQPKGTEQPAVEPTKEAKGETPVPGTPTKTSRSRAKKGTADL